MITRARPDYACREAKRGTDDARATRAGGTRWVARATADPQHARASTQAALAHVPLTTCNGRIRRPTRPVVSYKMTRVTQGDARVGSRGPRLRLGGALAGRWKR